VGDELDDLLAEQISYYRARAPRYLAEANLPIPDGELAVAQREVVATLDAVRPSGHILEIACGPGTWTDHLARHGESVTAVDASPEMLALAAERVTSERVRFIQANVFDWTPDRRYDTVFFGFWLSHVPLERFAFFWSLVRHALCSGGRAMFVDDAFRTSDELIEGEASSTIRRHVSDGRRFRIVKVPHTPEKLEQRIRELGWNMNVRRLAGPFFFGQGTPADG
jgi:demethylmenaquinone methyltransferase/2-methoxy-6-polyprenyl-1,4-benzoquinol methylase